VVMGEDIDPTAVAVMVEAALDADVPTQRPEERRDIALTRGMSRIDQRIQLRTLPSDLDADGATDGRNDPFQASDRDAADRSALQPRDDLPRHAGPPAERLLPPVAAQSQGTDGTWDIRVHRPIMATAAYQPLTLCR
jgi:hypothetical protein